MQPVKEAASEFPELPRDAKVGIPGIPRDSAMRLVMAPDTTLQSRIEIGSVLVQKHLKHLKNLKTSKASKASKNI